MFFRLQILNVNMLTALSGKSCLEIRLPEGLTEKVAKRLKRLFCKESKKGTGLEVNLLIRLAKSGTPFSGKTLFQGRSFLPFEYLEVHLVISILKQARPDSFLFQRLSNSDVC